MGNEEFFFNIKLISVSLYYMSLCDEYEYIDNFEYNTAVLGRKKRVKFKNKKWVSKSDRELLYYGYSQKHFDSTFDYDEDLLKFINPIGVNKYLIKGDNLYNAPKVVFTYINGETRIKYFEKNSMAQNYYDNFKSKFSEKDYTIFD